MNRLNTIFTQFLLFYAVHLTVATASTEFSTTELEYSADVSNTDLINGLTPAASTGWLINLAQLNDGLHGGNFGVLGNVVEGAWATPGSSAEYNLGTGANGFGYDITSIQSIASWSGDGFSNQAWTVEVRTVGGSWTLLDTVDYQPNTTGISSATKVVLDNAGSALATGVEAIRFTSASVVGSSNAGAFIWRELDVFGTPSTTATPVNPHPQTAASLWSSYQTQIENDPLNVTSYASVTSSSFALPVTVETIRYDLGSLVGTNSDGSAKTVTPKIAAFIAYPSDASASNKYPAIVDIHGGGQRPGWWATAEAAARGYVVISINWGALDLVSMGAPPFSDIEVTLTDGGNYSNTDWGGLTAGFSRVDSVSDPVTQGFHFTSEGIEPQTFSDAATLFEDAEHPLNVAFLLNSYAARRAITLLVNDPKVDTSKIGVSGFSMGGVTTGLTATDPRIVCAVPFVGGAGFTYDDLDRLPDVTGTGFYYNGQFAHDLPSYPYFKQVASLDSYWPDIQVPVMFVNATNDFNAPFDLIQPSFDLLPAGVKSVGVNTPHASHILESVAATSAVLWMREHLQDDFSFPDQPAAVLDLTDPSGVPLFSVTPDQSKASSVKKVEIYYGYDRYPLERYWHKAVAVETSPGVWQGACPVFDSSEPLVVFAEVFYDIGFAQNVGFGRDSTEFSVSSEVKFSNNKTDNTVPNITADNAPSRLIDSGADGLHDWYNYPLGVQWAYGTWKLGAPKFLGPQNASLALDIETTEANNVVAISVREGWGGATTYRTFASLPTAGANSLLLSPSLFLNTANGDAITTWDNIEVLDISIGSATDASAGYPAWSGADPSITNLRWVGGSHSNNSNEAPVFNTETNIIAPVEVDTPLSGSSVSGIATDPELSTITYAKVSGPTWLTVAPNGTLGGTPSSANIGDNNFIISAKDSAGGADYAEMRIEVGKVIIFEENFENSPPGDDLPVGTSGLNFGWTGTSFTANGFTFDVKVPNGNYSNGVNNLPVANFIGGQFYGSIGFNGLSTADTGLTFVDQTEYELSFLHYKTVGSVNGRDVTAQLYDVDNNTVYATETFVAVNDGNNATERTLSYTASGASVGRKIGIRFTGDSVDYDDGATSSFNENNLYSTAIDNIELSSNGSAPPVAMINVSCETSAIPQHFEGDESSSDLLNGIVPAQPGQRHPNPFSKVVNAVILTDGVHGAEFDLNNPSLAISSSSATTPNAILEYRLGAGVNGTGYDISSIQTIAAWTGGGFGNQSYLIDVKPVGGDWFQLADVDCQDGNVAASSKVTITGSNGTVTSGVEYIRFRVRGVTNVVNSIGREDFQWREIDVFGSASPVEAVSVAPTLVSVSPNTNTSRLALSNISTGTKLVAKFSEAVQLGTGSITVVNLDDNSTNIITLPNSQVTIDSIEESLLVIEPSLELGQGVSYAVQIDAGAITDKSGNAFAGIDENITWNFKTRETAPLRILCIGDSITVGYTEDFDADPYKFGYRSHLYHLLNDAGYVFQYVGASQQPWPDPLTGAPTTLGGDPTIGETYKPDFDLRDLGQEFHQGGGGATIGVVQAALSQVAADLVLLKVGINSIQLDGNGAPQTPTATLEANILGTVKAVLDTNSNIQAVIALTIPYAPTQTAQNTQLLAYNTYIKDQLLLDLTTDGYDANRVRVADMYSMFLEDPNDFNSAVAEERHSNNFNHPWNEAHEGAGYDTMAQEWFEAIESFDSLNQNSYQYWSQQATFGLPEIEQGFTADFDGDTIPNGIEAYFGTNPNVRTQGLNISVVNGSVSEFVHPQNSLVPVDLNASYQWSTNLVNWYDADGIEGPQSGLKITATPTTINGVTTVSLSPTEEQVRVFFRVEVEKAD